MKHLRFFALSVCLATTMVTVVAAQEPPPAGAFRAVHLVSLTPQQVAALQAWMADMNAVIAKAGHKEVRYRLYKVTGKQSGKYDFMWESAWPSGDVYMKIHNSPEWKSVADRHSGLNELAKTMRTNIALAESNVRLAAPIAVAYRTAAWPERAT